MNARAIIIGAAVVFIIVASMSATTIAQEDDWTPPPPPALPSTGGSGGGGGGGGSGSYSPPVFDPYIANLSSSDNTGIGSIEVKGYSLATVQALKSLEMGNDTIDVGLNADIGYMPSSISLDILPISLLNVTIPLDLDLFAPLAAFNMTRYSSGGEWQMKDSTVHLTLRLPVSLIDSVDLSSKFYLVKDDGTSFILYSAVPTIDNGFALFDVPLDYESRSPSTSGIFTLAGTSAQAASGATVTPTSEPVDATPSPKAAGSNASVFLLAAALGIIAILIGRRKS